MKEKFRSLHLKLEQAVIRELEFGIMVKRLTDNLGDQEDEFIMRILKAIDNGQEELVLRSKGKIKMTQKQRCRKSEMSRAP